MKPTSLLGIGSALVSSRKFKLIFVGAQFAYLAYKLLKSKKSDTKRTGMKKLKN